MKYREGLDFLKLRAGITIEDVPLDHLIFWTALNRPRDKVWMDRAREITEFQPVYFCKPCRQIEDGAHRVMALKMKGKKTCDVKIYSKCIHKNTGYWGLLEASLKKVEKEGARLHRLDYRWLRACCKDKWPVIRKVVNFKNKTVLDVGCQCGYSVLEAVRAGAKGAIGIDSRIEVLRAGKWAAYDILKYGFDKIILAPGKWEDYKVSKKDIVMCLGLLHYFPIHKYEELFTELLDTAKETVIMDLRIVTDIQKRLAQKGEQTVASTAWLLDKFGEKGFKIIEREVRKPHQRELWIAERK